MVLAVAEGRDFSQAQQIIVCGHQGQIQHLRRGSQKAVRWVLAWQHQLSRRQRDLMSKRCLAHGSRGASHPIGEVSRQSDFALGV